MCACVRAADVVGAFKTFIAASTSKGESLPSGVDMQVQVLTSGFWPSYPIMEAKLPEVRVCAWRGGGMGMGQACSPDFCPVTPLSWPG